MRRFFLMLFFLVGCSKADKQLGVMDKGVLKINDTTHRFTNILSNSEKYDYTLLMDHLHVQTVYYKPLDLYVSTVYRYNLDGFEINGVPVVELDHIFFRDVNVDGKIDEMYVFTKDNLTPAVYINLDNEWVEIVVKNIKSSETNGDAQGFMIGEVSKRYTFKDGSSYSYNFKKYCWEKSKEK